MSETRRYRSGDELDPGSYTGFPEPNVNGGQSNSPPSRKRQLGRVVGGQVQVSREIGHCRRNGVQIGTIHALLAQLCVRHDLVLLTTDGDFLRMAPHVRLTVWAN